MDCKPVGESANLDRKQLSELGQKRFAKIARAMYEEAYITKVQLDKVIATGNFGAPILFE